MLFKKLSSLSEISKAQLSKILSLCSGPKDLILETKLIKPLERLCGVKWLRGNGIEKIFKLEEVAPDSQNVLFYFICTNFKVFKLVINQIQSKIDIENPVKDKFHVVIVPKLLYIFEDILEELGLSGVIKLYSLQWQPIYLDIGILSLEVPYLYKSLYVEHDLSLLPIYAKSLWHLSFVIGKPKFYLALGQHSNSILKQLDTLHENLSGTDMLESDFGAVVLIDRNMDYVSALLTPATYAALLKEVYGVACGCCEYKKPEKEKVYDEKFNFVIKKEPVQFILDSTGDSVYRDIRNRYFTEVTTILRTLIKNLRSEGESSKEMALDEIKKYVATQLQASTSKKKFIANHLAASQTIVNTLGHRFEEHQETEQFIMQNKNKSGNFTYLENVLVTENNKHITLRLMCLMAITQKLSESEIHTFWNKFLHEFGYDYGFVQSNLIKAGILPEEQSSSMKLPNVPNIVSKLPKLLTNDFYINANKLKQIPTDPSKINLKAPTCCSYVYGGTYIPLVSQVASMLLSNTPLNEIKNKLEALGPLTIRNERGYPLQPRTILLYVVGGITYSEIAALNLLETLTGSTIVVCSDKVISGNDLMEEIMELV